MKSKVNIHIINHGEFGEAIIKSAELIVGKTDYISSSSLLPNMSIEDLIEAVEEKLKEMKGEIIVLTDMYGGTPNNVASVLQNRFNAEIVCGFNLPMLIELILTRDNGYMSAKELVNQAIETGKESIFSPKRIEI